MRVARPPARHVRRVLRQTAIPVGCASPPRRRARYRARRAVRRRRKPSPPDPAPGRATANARYADGPAVRPWPGRDGSALRRPVRPGVRADPEPVHKPLQVERRATPVARASRPNDPAARPARQGPPRGFPHCHKPPVARAGPGTTGDNKHRVPDARPDPRAGSHWPWKCAGCRDGSCRCPGRNAAPAPTRHRSPRARRRWSNWFRRCWWPVPLCACPAAPDRSPPVAPPGPVHRATDTAEPVGCHPRHRPIADARGGFPLAPAGTPARCRSRRSRLRGWSAPDAVR
ncbi:hypothetical protein D3C85_1010430 [compost metagenome]